MVSLPQKCYALVSQKIPMEQIPCFEDLTSLKLSNGEDGGSIKIYRAKKISKVTVVNLKLGKEGVPIPHHNNKLAIGAEVFQIFPDLSYKLPIWGINSIIMKDGTYYFDTDFSFGFDLVMDYSFTMKYLDPFNEVYKKFCRHSDLKRVFLDEMTTWVRTYISPLFFAAKTTINRVESVCELAGEYITLFLRMWEEAKKGDAVLKEKQQQRIKAQYEGMKHTDRMGKILLDAFGQETFSRFFKAMA